MHHNCQHIISIPNTVYTMPLRITPKINLSLRSLFFDELFYFNKIDLFHNVLCWWGWRDSNSHDFTRWNLNPVRLPITPHPLLIGSPTWARTTDQQINSLLLYRLSYWGIILLAFFRRKWCRCCLCVDHGSFKSVAIVLIFKLQQCHQCFCSFAEFKCWCCFHLFPLGYLFG